MSYFAKLYVAHFAKLYELFAKLYDAICQTLEDTTIGINETAETHQKQWSCVLLNDGLYSFGLTIGT